MYLVAGTAASATPVTLADHLPTTRPRYYPFDTSNAEWAVLAPHFPAAGHLNVPVAKIYHGLEQVRDAQADIESGTTPGKHVVVLDD